jgi:hypothetical protein
MSQNFPKEKKRKNVKERGKKKKRLRGFILTGIRTYTYAKKTYEKKKNIDVNVILSS